MNVEYFAGVSYPFTVSVRYLRSNAEDNVLYQNFLSKACLDQAFFVNFREIDSDDYFVGIFADDDLIGICTVGGADEKGLGVGHFIMSDVYVLPVYRHKKLGSYLVSATLLFYPPGSYIYVDLLDVDLSAFYTNLGFRSCGDYSFMYSDLFKVQLCG